MAKIDQKLKALEAFKDWSNYLLVTTVASLGWTAKENANGFCTQWMKSGAIALFALAVVFAILTLALIPHIAEKIEDDPEPKRKSIYDVCWPGWGVRLRLTHLCLPQHVLFLLGIVMYAAGTAFGPSISTCVFIFAVLALPLIVLLIGQIWRLSKKSPCQDTQ